MNERIDLVDLLQMLGLLPVLPGILIDMRELQVA